MWTALNRSLSGRWDRIIAIALATGVAGVASGPAMAGGRGDDRGRGSDRHDHRGRHDHHHDRRDNGGFRVDVDFRSGRTRVVNREWRGPRYEERRVRVWVEPVYKTVPDKVWVEPIFKTVCDRVWREPVVKTECERVWVPDRYETRWVTRTDSHGCRVRVRERVRVERGHFHERHHEVVVRPGGWETVERQELVFEGHWKECERQELVCAGRYEWRTDRVKVADGGWRDEAVLGIGIDLD